MATVVKLYPAEKGEELVRWIKETEEAILRQGRDALMTFMEQRVEFERRILEAGHRSEIVDSLLWHALAGSSIAGGWYRDFEGELSIVEFVKKLRREHLGEIKEENSR